MHTLRPATRSDLAHLPEIELAAGKLFPVERIPNPHATLPGEILQQSLESRLLLIAESNQKVVGFGAGLALDPWLHLEEISVHPDYARQGIGAALVRAIVQMSADRGMQGVTLTTFSDFSWNAPFYARLGFEPMEDNAAGPAHVVSRLEHEASLRMTHRIGMIYRHSV